MNHLVQKYNVPGPRYTSYPTVPFWNLESFSLPQWKKAVKDSFHTNNSKEGISLYIHLPFCEQMCTFCGCHKRITKRHDLEDPYITTLLKEWRLYLELFSERPIVKELHLGGGTPTFFSPANLKLLMEGLFKLADRAENFEFSFEGHPNNTTQEHLEVLYQLGYRRVSFGVQDYNETVQRAIHRIQPFEAVKKVTEKAREIGYESVSHDLIYGLPHQTKEDILETISKTKSLMPDRIALYSYAHVPWLKGNGQRGFSEEDLPTPDQKRAMYEAAKARLIEVGYFEIGMDHFALPSDSLYKAMETGSLHRNFMGYTQSKTRLMIGLGMSSISDSWTGFAQNEKNLETYTHRVQQGELPVYRGHILSEEDELIRTHILNLMTQFRTTWTDESGYFEDLPSCLESLLPMQEDGLLQIGEQSVQVFEAGKPFIRNICMAFDVLLQRNTPERKLFSMTI